MITYNVIKNNIDELIFSLKQHIYDKEYYLEVRAKNVNELSDIEVASRFIFLNRTGFNGLYRVNKKGQFNVPFGRYSNPVICDEENLRRVSRELQNVIIKHQDYTSVLKTHKKAILYILTRRTIRLIAPRRLQHTHLKVSWRKNKPNSEILL